MIRLRDIVSDPSQEESGRKFGGIELGAKNEDTPSALDGKPSVGLAIYQSPGSNALDTANLIRARNGGTEKDLSSRRWL